MNFQTRRRMLLSEGKRRYIFRSGIAQIKHGEISRQKNVTVRVQNILIGSTGYLSIKIDVTKYSKLFIEIKMLENVASGTTYGIGNTNDTFIMNDIADTATGTTKEFNISSIIGEKYINFVASDSVGSTNTYITNVWMEK